MYGHCRRRSFPIVFIVSDRCLSVGDRLLDNSDIIPSMDVYSHKEFWLKYGINPDLRYHDDDGHMMTKYQALYNARYKFIRGELVEVMCSSSPVFNGDGYGLIARDRSVRSRRDVPDPVNVARARKRAVGRLRDLIECNDWRYFVTLTFNGDLIDRGDYNAVVRRVNTYLDNRVRRSGWKYVGVVEYHKDHRGLHFHFLVDGDVRVVDSGCVLRPVGGRPVKRSTAYRQGYVDDDLRVVYNIADWSLGFSTAIEVYGNPRALARYVGKYLTKSDADKIGGRWYYHGGRLSEPVYKYDNLDFDRFIGDVDFDTDGGRFKIAYHDGGGV